jgi:gas vesicle protein
MNSSNNDNGSNGGNFGKIFAALLAGAAIGAAVGILYAPDKGKNTREKLSRKANKFGNDVKAKVEEVKGKMEHEFDNVRAQAAKQGERFDERKNDMANSVKQATDALKNNR